MLTLFYLGCGATTVLALWASDGRSDFYRRASICMVVTFAWLAILIGGLSSANALTIPSGHVISGDGEIVPACETESAKKSMANDNYHIFGGCLCIQAMNETVTIDLDDLRGKSKADVKQIIMSEIQTNLSDAAIDDVMNNLDVNEVNEITSEIADEIVETATNLAHELTRDEKIQIIADTIYDGNRWYTEKSWDANGFEGILDGTYDGNWGAKQNAADCIAAGGDC